MNRTLNKWLRQFDTPLLLIGLLAALALLTRVAGSAELERTVTEVLIRVVVVVGLFTFIGNSGLMSFGHVGFMCIGAYAAAWLTIPAPMKSFTLTGLPDWMLSAEVGLVTAVLFAACLSAACAALAGSVLMRLSGIAISIATFAMLAMVNVVYANWDSVTGGTSSLVGIPTDVSIWSALAWSSLVLLVAHVYSRSRWGMQLRALREDSVAARASGVNLYGVALVGFVLSAAVMGIGGALEAQFIGVINPDSFYLGQTFLFISMLVVGGSASMTGAVCGVLGISALIEALVRMEQGMELAGELWRVPGGTQEVVLGLVMVVMLAIRPRGAVGGKDWRIKAVGRNQPGL